MPAHDRMLLAAINHVAETQYLCENNLFVIKAE